MIVKKIKCQQADKPKVWQIGDLVDYIRNPQKVNAHEKIAHAGSRNFLSSTHNGQKAEMIALAQESVRSNMPVAHWIFSWRETEQPTCEQVDELVNIFLARMGLTEHQTVYALHHNTEHFHVHIAVNRTHPDTLKVVQPHKGFDIEVAHQIVALVEHKQGWLSTENARYTVLENGEVTRARREHKIQPRPQAQDFERAAGEKSAQRIAQERGHGIIKNATSWEELHQQLAEKGLRFEKKGSGALIFVGEIAVKASSVDRDFGMSKLCKRLGEFIPAPSAEEADTPPPPLSPEPVSAINIEEWRQYQQERAKTLEEQPGVRPQARLQSLKEWQREERKRILPTLAKHGLHILNIARHFLKVKQREELQQARQATRPAPISRKPRFETWLRDRGLHVQANRWRHRARLEKPQPPVPSPALIVPPDHTELQQLEKYLAAVNADRVRVTCLRMMEDGSRKAFILDKQGGMSKGFTPEELRAHLPEMLRLQRRGENIYFTPLSEGKHHILIDDMTRETVEKFYADGFRPAVVLESSPGNYQCVLTIPKLKNPHNREVGNRLTEQLNKQYGDPKLSGCIHPHRAPGFANFKPQHRREGDKYPRANLRHAEKKECTKALELSRRIERECVAAEAKRQQMHPPRPAPQTPQPGSTASAYYAHYEDIRKRITTEDLSRVDAMIAVRLRATGHSQEAIAEALLQCARTIRQSVPKRETRNWHRYAERTAAYAFGVAGDVALAKNARLVEHWRKAEGLTGNKANQEASPLRPR